VPRSRTSTPSPIGARLTASSLDTPGQAAPPNRDRRDASADSTTGDTLAPPATDSVVVDFPTGSPANSDADGTGDSENTNSANGGTDANDHDPTEQSAIAMTLDLIGDRWCFLILRDAFRGIRRFDDFRTELGIARPVLADRLKRLVDAGVLTKVRYCDRPVRYEYRLTTRGLELSPVLVALMQWGDRHLGDPNGPRRVLVHDACDHPIDLVTVCWHCDTTIGPTAISSRPGPGTPGRKLPRGRSGSAQRTAR
jgi:DNA-binding HxlR family transcriptional regulator